MYCFKVDLFSFEMIMIPILSTIPKLFLMSSFHINAFFHISSSIGLSEMEVVFTENFKHWELFIYVFDTFYGYICFNRAKWYQCVSNVVFFMNGLTYFGCYTKNVVTNGKLLVFLSLFYGQFVLVMMSNFMSLYCLK